MASSTAARMTSTVCASAPSAPPDESGSGGGGSNLSPPASASYNENGGGGSRYPHLPPLSPFADSSDTGVGEGHQVTVYHLTPGGKGSSKHHSRLSLIPGSHSHRAPASAPYNENGGNGRKSPGTNTVDKTQNIADAVFIFFVGMSCFFASVCLDPWGTLSGLGVGLFVGYKFSSWQEKGPTSYPPSYAATLCVLSMLGALSKAKKLSKTPSVDRAIPFSSMLVMGYGLYRTAIKG